MPSEDKYKYYLYSGSSFKRIVRVLADKKAWPKARLKVGHSRIHLYRDSDLRSGYTSEDVANSLWRSPHKWLIITKEKANEMCKEWEAGVSEHASVKKFAKEEDVTYDV